MNNWRPYAWQQEFDALIFGCYEAGELLYVTERVDLQFRAEVFNLFNRAQYRTPLVDVSAPSTFGRITTLVNNGPPAPALRGNSNSLCVSDSRRTVDP